MSNRIISTSLDTYIKEWDLTFDGNTVKVELIREIPTNDLIHSICINKLTNQIVIGLYCKIVIYDLEFSYKMEFSNFKDVISKILYYKNNQYIVLCSDVYLIEISESITILKNITNDLPNLFNYSIFELLYLNECVLFDQKGTLTKLDLNSHESQSKEIHKGNILSILSGEKISYITGSDDCTIKILDNLMNIVQSIVMDGFVFTLFMDDNEECLYSGDYNGIMTLFTKKDTKFNKIKEEKVFKSSEILKISRINLEKIDDNSKDLNLITNFICLGNCFISKLLSMDLKSSHELKLHSTKTTNVINYC